MPPSGAVSDVLHAAFEQAPFVGIVYEGPDLVVAAANAAARELFGAPLVGKPVREAVPGINSEGIFTLLQGVYESGLPVRKTEWRFTSVVSEPAQERWFTFLAVPLLGSDGAIIGVTVQGLEVTEQVLQHEREARQTLLAEANHRASQDVVADLQHAMLPAALPVLPQLILSASYQVAGQGQLAGGDWFDVIPLDDGTVVLVVGDVVGHGVSASVAMGQLRTVLLSQLDDGVPLEAALRRVERYAATTPTARATTAVVAVLDPRTGRISYATCGHPPPLVVSQDGGTRFLPLSGAGPLGVGASAPLAEEVLASGDVLLLYSDGIIERGGVGLDRGMAELAAIAGDAMTGRLIPMGGASSRADAVCRLTTELLGRAAEHLDDVTVVTAELSAQSPTDLLVRLPAVPSSLAGLRAALESWLAQFGLRATEQTELMLTSTEAISNAVEHAYVGKDAPGSVAVAARLLNDGCVVLSVSDDGAWRPDGEQVGFRGHGLAIMEQLAADLNVVRRPDGTTVELWHRLTRPIHYGRHPLSPSSRPSDHAGLSIEVTTESGVRMLQCSGSVDTATADDLDRAVTLASQGGQWPVVIDLTELDLLTSAGVGVLLARSTPSITLVAAPGSPARTVLELVGAVPATPVLDAPPSP